ncbi:MAG: hypothetical protein OEQ13_08590 [Acidobacteriota bacterium]|nr:hypothetical protein [Acidobacteriota bacterium]
MRAPAFAAALALLASSIAGAEEPLPADTAASVPVEVDVRLALAGDGTAWRDPASEPPHPGETLALALSWPEGVRPERPRLADVGGSDEERPFRAIGLVPRLPAAANEDVVLLLPLQLGELTVPPLSIVDGEGRPVARTRELTLAIAPALDEEDTEPAPARPAAAISLDPAGIAIVLGTLAVLAALLFWLVRRMRRREKEEPTAPPPPAIPAHVKALADLDELLGSGLLARGALKPFSVRLAEIGKTYVSAHAGVSLMERTTTECERLLSRKPAAREEAAWLVRWLGALDLVKFANDRPETSVLSRMAEELREWIVRVQAARESADGDEPAGPRDGTAPRGTTAPTGRDAGAPKPWPAPESPR